MQSGILREGSSHYHLLLTRNYLDVTLAARRHGRSEQAEFEDVARKALAVARELRLPGGFPLIGDISPDSPPQYLTCLSNSDIRTGWLESLSEDEREYVLSLMDRAANREALAYDGWLRKKQGPWSGLWHASPKGWCAMPGHGHQDCGGFELHCEDEAVLIDPGRGAYGQEGEAFKYASGEVHNILLIDGADPFPPNKPYYNEFFRNQICGNGTTVKSEPYLTIEHDGYTRFPGVGKVSRQFQPFMNGWRIFSRVEGSGQRTISQHFVTPLIVELKGNEATLVGREKYRFRAQSLWHTQAVTIWSAYGKGTSGTILALEETTTLPFYSQVDLEIM